MIEIDFVKLVSFYITLTFIISYFSTYFSIKYFQKMYFVNISNNKNSLHKDTILRGSGILYILPLITVLLISDNLFDSKEILLITSTTLLGYIDDKKNLSQKIKMFVLILIFFLIYFDYKTLDFNNMSLLFVNLCFFLFFVLFFNQIDGINGLSASTFLVFIGFLFVLTSFSNISVPIFITVFTSVLVYLNFNVRVKSVLQGDSGSYFLGTFIYIITSRHYDTINMFWSFALIIPLLIDVSLTTFSRLYYRKKIFEGHRDNIYQQLTIYFNSHFKVTFTFILIQVVIATIYIYFKKYTNDYFSIFLVFSFLLLTSFVWLILHKKFNVRNQ